MSKFQKKSPNKFCEFLRPQKNWSWSSAAILNFSKTLKITCTSPYRGECHSKIWIISDFRFQSFCAHKKNWVDLWRPFWISVASLKNHLHIPMLLGMWCWNCKKNDQTNFLSYLRLPKNLGWSVAAILNFSIILKKSPAHLHKVGNVIAKFE